MIYRILIQEPTGEWVDGWTRDTIMEVYYLYEEEFKDFKGPKKRFAKFNHKGRFYFTERGYERFGRKLLDRAQARGRKVKVIRRKNPKRSDVTYADPYQVALLPNKRK